MDTADFHFACLFFFGLVGFRRLFSPAVNGDKTCGLFFPGFKGGGGLLLSPFWLV